MHRTIMLLPICTPRVFSHGLVHLLVLCTALPLVEAFSRNDEIRPDLYYENQEGFTEKFEILKSVNYTFGLPPTTPLNLNLKLILKELIDLDVKKEELCVMTWLRLIWQDDRLSWNEDEFGIREIRMFPGNIWTPDIMVMNAAQEMPKATSLPATVDSTGWVYWFLPMRITTKCETDVTFFPYDVQTCIIALGSWTYSDRLIKISISTYETLLEKLGGNIQWTVSEISSELQYFESEEAPNYQNKSMRPTYSKVEYKLSIKRKADFYVYCIFVPIILCTTLGFMTFLIPADNGAKVGFPISMFLALFVNQLVISEYVPPSADTMPLVTSMCTFISVLFAINVAQTSIVLRLFHSELSTSQTLRSRTVRSVVQAMENLGKRSYLYSKAPKLLKTENSKETDESQKIYEVDFEAVAKIVSDECSTTVLENSNITRRRDSDVSNDSERKHDSSRVVSKLLAEITDIVGVMSRMELKETVLRKWHTVAAGADLLFLYYYSLSVLSLLIYLLKAIYF